MGGANPKSSTMSKATSLLCLALLAVGGLQTWSALTPPQSPLVFPWYVWIAPVVGAAGLLAHAWLCWKAVWPVGLKWLVMLAAPFACLVIAGIVSLLDLGDFRRAFATPPDQGLLEAVFSSVSVGLRVRAIALTWAALSFLGIVLVAANTGHLLPGDAQKPHLRWVWIAVGVLGALDALLISPPMVTPWAKLAEWSPANELKNHGMPDLISIIAGRLGLLLAAGGLALGSFLLARVSAITKGLDDSSKRRVTAVLGLGAVSILAGTIAAASAYKTKLCADVLWARASWVFLSEPSPPFVETTEAALVNATSAGLALDLLIVAAVVVAALVAWQARRRVRVWLPLLALWLVVLGFYSWAGFHSYYHRGSEMQTEHNGCLDVSLLRYLGAAELDFTVTEKDWRSELFRRSGFELPRVRRGRPIMDMVVIEVSKASITVDDVKVADLEDGKLRSGIQDSNGREPLVIVPLHEALSEKVTHLKMISARVNAKFKAMVGIAMHPDTSAGLIEEIRHTAHQAGFVKHFFYVRGPQRAGQLCDDVWMTAGPDYSPVRTPFPEKPYIDLIRQAQAESESEL